MRRISHRKAQYLINYLADFPVNEKEQSQLEAHLLECSKCLQYREYLQKTEKILFKIMRNHWNGGGLDFSIQTILPRSRRLKVRKKIWYSIKILGAATLAIALLIIVGTFFRQRDFSLTSNTGAQEYTSTPTITETITMLASQGAFAGQWVAITDFGKLILTVDRSGKRIIRTDFQFSEWTCGTTIHSGKNIVDASDWLITDNKFIIYTPFDRYSQSGIYINGIFDPRNQNLSGTWEEFSNATTCSGTWEASLTTP
jgi:hypothetical protein